MKKLLILLLVAIFPTCKSPQINQLNDLKLLQETDKNQAEACAAKDINRLLSFYEDGAFGIIDSNTIRGKDNLRQFWKSLFLMPDFFLTWQLKDAYIAESGDLGFTSGTWEQQLTQDGKLIKTSGKYLTVWHKQKDGTWKELVGKP